MPTKSIQIPKHSHSKKTRLVKALILPVIHCPLIPIYSVSKMSTSKLLRTQNISLRFTNEQETSYYSLNTRVIHEVTNTNPANVRLHKRARKTWLKLEELINPPLKQLKNNRENITKCHKNFPNSLDRTENPPDSIYYYRIILNKKNSH